MHCKTADAALSRTTLNLGQSKRRQVLALRAHAPHGCVSLTPEANKRPLACPWHGCLVLRMAQDHWMDDRSHQRTRRKLKDWPGRRMSWGGMTRSLSLDATRRSRSVGDLDTAATFSPNENPASKKASIIHRSASGQHRVSNWVHAGPWPPGALNFRRGGAALLPSAPRPHPCARHRATTDCTNQSGTPPDH